VFSTDRDGFGAAFATASDAVDAAIDAQQHLIDAALPLAVRMGLHTGEATTHEDGYVGPTVTRALRLATLAHGGQIIVSDTTEVLLGDRVALRPLGDHRLRGVRGRVTVHQVLASGLRADFPMLRTDQGFTGNLSLQLSSFVGREDLVGTVADLVRSERLVTLTGVGGVGKTRLALEVGAELAGDFPDGVWVIDLAQVSDEGSVPAALASVLGVTPQGDVPLIDTVAGSLAGRRLLLIVDNCEHLVDAAGVAVRAILGRSETVHALATSREHLWVGGEAVVSVLPLALDGGASSDAVALFLDRARSVRAEFGLQDADTTAAVIEVCEVLDGLPLGIELAAARMAAMTAVEVRDRLADRFRLLKGAALAPERQQTLRHAVAWSYELLPDDERELLRITSVFAGGFDLATLTAVAKADEVDVLERLDSLVRKSLVVADHSTTRTRYRLFETIRQFAEDELTDAGERDSARDAHAAHFGAEAATRWDRWEGPGWRDAVDWVDVELGNLRGGQRWSSERGDVEIATDIAAHSALIGFSVQLFETLGWAEALIEAATEADVRRLPRLLVAAGYACFAGRAEAGRVHAHRAVELEGDPRYDGCQLGYAPFVEALCQVYCGDLDRYVELTGEVARRYGRARGYGLASYVDGLQASGQVDEAVALAEESVTAARDHGNPYWIAYALWIAGQAFAKVDTRRALAAWDEGVSFVREHRVQFFEGFLARDAARLHAVSGEPLHALVLFHEAIDAFHRAGNVPQLIITLASVPQLFERIARLEPAATLTAAVAREPSSFHHVPELREVAERVAATLGDKKAKEAAAAGAAFDLDEAASYARQQIDIARRIPLADSRPVQPGGLSRREVEVLRLVAEGLTAREIASRLFISARTAEHHIQHVYTKIGASGRAAATRWAVEQNLL
ncbi:MAG TPA: LuxR C-terminal-related transcriptional regulator, partial [Acidimicrobiales bacterium]|nr:LuxR C-terminal-related transcriptional regulator [Acidimicrobiales bacterium]